jgi:hypothetical protein
VQICVRGVARPAGPLDAQKNQSSTFPTRLRTGWGFLIHTSKRTPTENVRARSRLNTAGTLRKSSERALASQSACPWRRRQHRESKRPSPPRAPCTRDDLAQADSRNAASDAGRLVVAAWGLMSAVIA